MFPQISPKSILCSLEINDHVPLFPKTHRRYSNMKQPDRKEIVEIFSINEAYNTC